MKMMKRLGALTLALVMALSGCGGKGDSSGSASSGSSAASGSAGDSSQAEPMDLSQVTDPYLTASGLAGDEVVARVGDSEITAADYLYWLNQGIENYLTQAGGQTSALLWDSEISPGLTLARYMLDNAADLSAFHCVLRQVAQREDLYPDPGVSSDIEKQYEDMTTQAGGEEQVDHVFWASMLTKDQLIKLNENSDLFNQLKQLYFGEDSGHSPTDAEVTAYLEESGQYRAKHILLSTIDLSTREPLDEETVARKKATADDLLAQLRKAEDPIALFDRLMNEYSEDTGLAANPDGYTTSKGQMVEPFETAALALQPGGISEVVESEYGYHIILRLPMNPDEFRDECVSHLLEEKLNEERERLGYTETDALGKVDVSAFWDKMQSIQAAVYEENAG